VLNTFVEVLDVLFNKRHRVMLELIKAEKEVLVDLWRDTYIRNRAGKFAFLEQVVSEILLAELNA
jgi:hypothetical protein